MLDVATAFLTILLRGEDGEAYNIADKNSVVTLGGLAESMARSNGCKVVYDIPDAAEATGYSNLLNGVMNAEKLESLGWRPLVHMEEGISRTIHILKGTDQS